MPLSTDEQDRLDALSKFSRDTLPSTTLPSGVVVLDLYRGPFICRPSARLKNLPYGVEVAAASCTSTPVA